MEKKEHKGVPVWVLVIVVAVVVIGIFVAILIRSMIGETTTGGGSEGMVSTQNLICERSGMIYPVFTYDNSDSKILKINVVFTNDKLSTISLSNRLSYETKDQAEASEANNHAAMNKSFGARYGADAFNAVYSIVNSDFMMTLYASSADLNSDSAKYFLLETNSGRVPSSQKEVQKALADKGVKCVENNK